MSEDSAFDAFRRERKEAIDMGYDSFVFSNNGHKYKRVYDDSAVIKFKRVGGRRSSRKRSRRRSGRQNRR